MNWLVLAFALQLGYSPLAQVTEYQPPSVVMSSQGLFVGMDAELRVWDHLYFGGGMEVPMWISGASVGPLWPYSLQSVVRAGVRFGGLEIGWSHLCTHPIVPYQPFFGEQPLWEGATNEFHIKLSGEIHL